MGDSIKATEAKAFGRYMATRAAREMFKQNGYVDATTIVVCSEADKIGDVMARAHVHGKPTLIAVHFPKREGLRQFGVISVDRSDGSAQEGGRVGKTSAIGMLFDSMQGRGRGRFTFEFGNFGPVGLGAFELANA